MENKPVDPHATEGHTQAHREAFDALIERVGKGLAGGDNNQDPRYPARAIGSKVYRAFPRRGGVDIER